MFSIFLAKTKHETVFIQFVGNYNEHFRDMPNLLRFSILVALVENWGAISARIGATFGVGRSM